MTKQKFIDLDLIISLSYANNSWIRSKNIPDKDYLDIIKARYDALYGFSTKAVPASIVNGTSSIINYTSNYDPFDYTSSYVPASSTITSTITYKFTPSTSFWNTPSSSNTYTLGN